MKNHHKSLIVIRRSDLARLTGCNIETIRYYENIGVMPEPPRTSKNYRVYKSKSSIQNVFFEFTDTVQISQKSVLKYKI